MASRYSEDTSRKWLSWIARNMRENGRTVFLIEDLQSAWLPFRWLRIIQWILPIIVISITLGVVTGLGVALIYYMSPNLDPAIGLYTGVRIGGTVGMIGGTLFSTDQRYLSISTVGSTIWSWQKLKVRPFARFISGALKGVILAIILFVLINGLFWRFSALFDIRMIVKYIVNGLLIGGFIEVVASGWVKRVSEKTTSPNEGILLSLQSSAKGLVLGLTLGFILGKIFGFSGVLIFESVFGLIGTLWFGGIAVIRHYTLRWLIFFCGIGPWNFVGFLDHAVEDLQFMQRVGGGYIFIHRVMLEHFADTDGN